MRRRPRKGATQPSLWPSSPRRGREPTQRRPAARAMGGGDAARPAVPRPPSARSLLVLQNQLASGMWAERHVAALGEDVANAQAIVSLLECTRNAHQFLASRPGKQRQAQQRCAPPRRAPLSPPLPQSRPSLLFCVQRARCSRLFCSRLFCARARRRNLVCVCNAVCPDETSAWASCFRAVAKKQREGKDTSELGNCEEARRQLDVCTQHASTRLLHAAVLPSDRSDVL